MGWWGVVGLWLFIAGFIFRGVVTWHANRWIERKRPYFGTGIPWYVRIYFRCFNR